MTALVVILSLTVAAEAGPVDTATGGGDHVTWEAMLESGRRLWSFQPVRKPELPDVQDDSWSQHPVDRFVLSRLEAAGLRPTPAADRRALIRRVSLALTGLPPRPQDVDAFAADRSESAYEELVDRLLASPHFGERWARHWMDVMRFAETHGHEWNFEVRGAWRYRDYLIRAFNQDVPYDQLIREHLAGDLLKEPRWNDVKLINESVMGTAFYRFGEMGHDDCLEFQEIGLEVLDNQLDTLSKAFQGLTVSCARCHDHKLDAISMHDYYALCGILGSSRHVIHTADHPQRYEEVKRRLTQLKAQIREELANAWQGDAAQVEGFLTASTAGSSEGGGLDAERLARWTHVLRVVEKEENEEEKEEEKSEEGADKKEKEEVTLELEHPLYPWRALRTVEEDDDRSFVVRWQELRKRYTDERRQRAAFNSEHFVPFGDFRSAEADSEASNDKHIPEWHATGHGLSDDAMRSGDFAILEDGNRIVRSVLRAGSYTHTLSNRLNGSLRSPFLPKDKESISVEVLGSGDSIVRMIYDDCHLGLAIEYLDSDTPKWVTYPTQHQYTENLIYVALATRFDSQGYPKMENMREVDVDNVRSHFGVTRAVLHDGTETPKDELSHMVRLLDRDDAASLDDMIATYATVIRGAIDAWIDDRTTDDDVRWLQWLIGEDLLTNSVTATPRMQELVTRYRELERTISPPETIAGLADLEPGFDVALRIRGEPRDLGDRIPRRYLQVLSGSDKGLRIQGSGRLEMASMIASPRNPLTARVMVNRVWHHLFGQGIVRTADNFGSIGDRPSHPELLDYLAWTFVGGNGSAADETTGNSQDEAWSVKRLIRSLVLTRAYRMSSRPDPGAVSIDPENRLLHHYPLRRMEAETIRDSILTTSGRLVGLLYGPSIHPHRFKPRPVRRLFGGPLDGRGRRSIYTKVTLTEEPPFLAVFNMPEPKVTRGRRDVTSVPNQALTMLNDPFVNQQADLWAKRLVAMDSTSVATRVDAIFRTALGRPPQDTETERFERAVERLAALHEVPAAEVLQSEKVWRDVAHSVFNMKEFIFVR